MTDAVQHKLRVEKESLKKVTVFEDRAELKREFTAELKKGLNEVVIENVSWNIHDDSVRVTGKGKAKIEEVQVRDRVSTEGSGDSERAKELREKKKVAEENVKRIQNEGVSLQKRTEALDAMLGQIGSGIAAPKDSKFVADEGTLGSITTFFTFYDLEANKLRTQTFVKEKELKEAEENLRVIESELRGIDQGDRIKSISILLDALEEGKVELELTYQVWGARWYTFYDLRVDTKEGSKDVQLSYFANVSQSSGEDWEGAELVLSTARPCLGGNIPELGTLDVLFYRPPPPPQAMAFGGAAPRMRTMKASVEPSVFLASASNDMMESSIATVSSQTLSTEFVITRPCAIPSDGANHKVTVGIISLSPQLVHESVPSKNTAAFLTASCINTSSLPLLSGEASVYLDGAFVAKTNLKPVSPGERFSSSLGVDAAIKIEYKPVHKYHEQTGLLSKSSSTVHEQKIIIKNTRNEPVLLTIKEHVPRSTDEKIKVKLISPENVTKVTEEEVSSSEHSPSAGIRMLPSNNLEWTIKLDKGASQTLLLKYSIDHPPNEKIEFAERFGS